MDHLDQSFTESARRALKSAGRYASFAASPTIEPQHLLWALWRDGARAAEILIDHGFTDPHVLQICGFDTGPIETTDDNPHAPSGQPAPGATVRDVIREAQRQLGGAHGEVGSELLLLGLVVVESTLAQALRSRGLDQQAVALRASQATGITGEPLDVDFSLSPVAQTATDQTDTLRIIDAAANRAREGLRVLEDFVRFSRDDALLTRELKQLRHDLTHALGDVDQQGLLAARQTERDVGTTISTSAETQRDTPLAVVRAAFKRTQEALRTLEEFSKVLAADYGARFEAIRYHLYTLEKALLQIEESRRRLDGRLLYLLASEDMCPHGLGPVIRGALGAGLDIVQLREKTMPDRRLLDLARHVRSWTLESGALFIMNDRPDLAVLRDADGVHVGQDELSVHDARRIVGPKRLVGVSTHTIEQARQAVIDGADYIGVGPVFPSQTKQFEQLAGLDFVRQVAAEIKLPWFAIGGISEDNIEQVLAAGATRVAVSSAICGAEQPGEVTARLRQLLSEPER